MLLGSDRTSLCAIASYIDEPFMDLDRDLLEDWPPDRALSALGMGPGRWRSKAGDDSTELSHPGALWLRFGCKDSPIFCLYLRMEAVINRSRQGNYLALVLSQSYHPLVERVKTCMPTPDWPRNKHLKDLEKWHLYWSFALVKIQIEPFIYIYKILLKICTIQQIIC